MGNLRQRQTLLEENIKLKKQKEELNDKVDKALSEINDKLEKMVRAMEEINKRDRRIVIQNDTPVFDGDEPKSIKETTKKKQYTPSPFIPSSDTSGMKMNAAPIEKKKRKTDLSSTIHKLSKLKNSDRGE